MKVVRNTLIYTAVSAVKRATGFLLLPLYSFYISTEDYGQVSVITALTQVLSIVCIFSLNTAGMRYHHEFLERDIDVNKLWGTLYWLVMIVTVTVVGLAILFRNLLVGTLSGNFVFFPLVAFGLAVVLFLPVYRLYHTYLRVRQNARESGIVELLYVAANIALVVILLVGFGKKAEGVILALGLTTAVFFVYSTFRLLSVTGGTFSTRIAKQVLKYSLPLLPHALAGWTMTMIDRFFLNNMMSTADAGVYTIGFQLASIVMLVVISINQAYSPWYFEQVLRGPSGKSRIIDFSEAIVLVISVGALFLSFFSKEALLLMTSGDYQHGWTVVPLLSYAFVFQGIYYMVIGPVFRQSPKVVPLITLASTLINVALNFVLIHRFGRVGAAAASLLSMVVYSGLGLLFSLRVGEINYSWRRMYSYAILSLASSLISYLPVGNPVAHLSMKVCVGAGWLAFVLLKYKNRGYVIMDALRKTPRHDRNELVRHPRRLDTDQCLYPI